MALAAVAVYPFSLYVVLLFYWADLFVGVVRVAFETAFAAPRETYSPLEPPGIHRNGDPGAFRFSIPKLGRLKTVGWLPAVAVHNLVPTLAGVLVVTISAVAVGVTTTFLDPPFSVLSWPTSTALAAGGLAVVVKHGTTFRRFVNSPRPPADRTLRIGPCAGCVLLALPVVAVDTVHAGAEFDPSTLFATIAVLVVLGRVAFERRRDASVTPADSFEHAAPTGRSREVFRPNRRAVRTAGLLDGVLPQIEWGVLNVTSRVTALFVLASVGFLAGGMSGLDPTPALVLGVATALTVTAVGFGVAGVAHFDLAFATTEYRLYDDELVAYDTRLDAVQWRAPLDAIHDVSVEGGPWLAPPGTDAVAVTLDRSDLDVDQRPYGFYRQTLAYVDRPEQAADRLRRATAR
jgi:hypothetical protein